MSFRMVSAVVLGAAMVSCARSGAAQSARDTSEVLRLVSEHVRRTAARSDSSRAERCAAGGGQGCATSRPIWYIERPSRAATELATAARSRIRVVAFDGPQPVCAWDGDAPATAGFRTTVRLEFARPDSATVSISKTCTNPSGFRNAKYASSLVYTLRRGTSAWIFLDIAAAAT